MHAWLVALFVALAAALAAPAAHALPFTGTLTIVYADPSIAIAGSGGGTASGSGLSFGLAGGELAVAGSSGVPMSFPPGIVQVDATATNAAGSFSGGSGSMALSGTLGHHFFAVGEIISIPLSPVGVGGSAPFSSVVLGNPATGTISGDPWTTGAISVVGSSLSLAASGFDARAPDGTGAVRYVSPYLVDLTISTTNVVLPGYAQLDLVFVPEPGTALLLGAGLLALVARRRG